MNWKGDRAHRNGGALGQRNTMFAASRSDAVALWEGRSPADASTGVHAARKSVELPRELCCLVSTANFHHILDPEHRSARRQESIRYSARGKGTCAAYRLQNGLESSFSAYQFYHPMQIFDTSSVRSARWKLLVCFAQHIDQSFHIMDAHALSQALNECWR